MRKRCKRKVWPLMDVVSHAIAGACITDKTRLDKLRLCELAALDAFAKGMAEPEDWRVLGDMLNVSEQMANDGIGPEALPVNLEAQQAMKAANARGKLEFTAPELQTMRNAYEYADLQRSSIARSEFERAITRTQNTIARAIASGKAEIVQVNQGASA